MEELTSQGNTLAMWVHLIHGTIVVEMLFTGLSCLGYDTP